jgi:hypothetical protein
MEKTIVYFEDSQTQMVDITGYRHVVMKSIGFALMRITALVSIWTDGQKVPSFKRELKWYYSKTGWTNAVHITTKSMKWIDLIFPLVDTAVGECVVWDSCKAHIAKNVK